MCGCVVLCYVPLDIYNIGPVLSLNNYDEQLLFLLMDIKQIFLLSMLWQLRFNKEIVKLRLLLCKWKTYILYVLEEKCRMFFNITFSSIIIFNSYIL